VAHRHLRDFPLGKPREPCGACGIRETAESKQLVCRRGFVANGGYIDVRCTANGRHIGAGCAVNSQYIYRRVICGAFLVSGIAGGRAP
jgi:hypothetical protein